MRKAAISHATDATKDEFDLKRLRHMELAINAAVSDASV